MRAFPAVVTTDSHDPVPCCRPLLAMISYQRHLNAAITAVFFYLFAIGSCENHIPSLNEISRIDDPVLKEVFKSSGLDKQGTGSPVEERPQLPESGPPQVRVEPYYGEIPIEHNNNQQPLGVVPPRRQRPDAVGMAVQTGANAFASGADALYRGGTSVARAFGFNPQAYEAPLFSAATQLLGKK
ncbi:unnamed protein product [Cylicocyclus nassatus]|uniref:Uncharacterized protein n=1 Tax=Cylicocyclus nassatus TaxID=53992 RepID=A0AA36DP25_CYLNA|nr:unnamed protein product [Cylicocyclus nassatus]